MIKIIIGTCRERKTKEWKGKWKLEKTGERILEFSQIRYVNKYFKKRNELIRICKNGGNKLQVDCFLVRRKMLK